MSKRGENIYKRKDGRWEGRYLKESKKYGYVYGKTYKEAKEKLILAKVNTEKNSNKTHVAVLCDNWLLYKEQYIKESSFVKYKNILEKYVKPYFNRIPVNKIDEYIIEDFAKSLIIKGYSVKTVKITLSVLESVFLYSKINIPFKRLLLFGRHNKPSEKHGKPPPGSFPCFFLELAVLQKFVELFYCDKLCSNFAITLFKSRLYLHSITMFSGSLSMVTVG